MVKPAFFSCRRDARTGAVRVRSRPRLTRHSHFPPALCSQIAFPLKSSLGRLA